MVHEIYEQLADERGLILEYLGDDSLALEELRSYFPERYREAMSATTKTAEMQKTPCHCRHLCQGFGQSQGVYADNYL